VSQFKKGQQKTNKIKGLAGALPASNSLILKAFLLQKLVALNAGIDYINNINSTLKPRRTDMRWFEKLASYIEKNGGKRSLYREGPDGNPALYMDRYYIIKSRFCEVMLHNFHQGDRPDLHDHPWASGGVILAEGYREHTPKGVAEKHAGSWGFRGSKSFHWVELREGTEGKVWSLFFTFKRVREWGFLVDGEWLHFEEYFRRNGTLATQTKPEAYRGWFFPRKVAA